MIPQLSIVFNYILTGIEFLSRGKTQAKFFALKG